MAKLRPLVSSVTKFGNDASFWVEYPSGLIDLTRTLSAPIAGHDTPPDLLPGQLDVAVDGERTIRIEGKSSAIVIIDMQNFFLHPGLGRDHPTGLKCVEPLMKLVPAARKKNIKVLWVNWGLTDHELQTIPPSLVRGFTKAGRGGFGSELPGGFGRLLMRDALNSDLYGPLQEEYLKGKDLGTDFWIHKNRMSGLWGYQSALDLFLAENGITTLFFAGVNTDQCVLGTLVDSYYRGYDCVLLKDATATTSPEGGYENVVYNATAGYGFATTTAKLL
ncbi:Isochorismatase hydrolase [Armillaria luteobubalina]|uniref:Isochorismatase hydrolase n=1 Tax=Armillaria luteobubalina TaxID=153913 RepID=A0AA39QPP5_9AGAR|nr:Isochorismatase hydrolase [Armillaria luteobubalina]